MLITNGRIITWEKPNRILEGYAVRIENDFIQEVDVQKTLMEKFPHDEVMDAKGQILMPGNICAHTHFYGAFARGMYIPGAAAKDFPEILQKLWFPLDLSLSMEDVRYSALVSVVDAIRHGTTTLIDHHASGDAVGGSLDEIARVIDESGIRASLCYEVTDRNGKENTLAAIKENVRFIDYVNKEKPLNGRLSALFGLHASLTLSEESLDLCRDAAPDGTGFHVHVAEHYSDQYDSIAKSGTRVVDRLQKHGILGLKTIAVHGVHLDARELQILAETGTWLTHQPRSNMNNAVGVAAIEAAMRMGVKVGLGNDGMGNAMWEEWKTTYFIHKLEHRDPRRMPATDIAQMAIYNNASLVNTLFPVKVGAVVPGAQADLILVNYQPYTPMTVDNLPWHIVFGFHESMVTMTMVAGKVLMKDRQLLTLDEEKIARYAAEKLVPQTWDRYHKRFN